MKIKPLQMTAARRKKARSSTFHWWLEADKPKSKGRLSQLTKQNQRMKNTKSEFIVMAEDAEARALARSA